MRIIIRNYLKFKKSTLPGGIYDALQKLATYRDPLYKIRKRMGISTEGLSPVMTTYQESERYLYLWRGALGDVVRLCKKRGVEYELVDKRLRLDPIELDCRIKLRDYQKLPVEVMLKRQQTIGRGPCGVGKTEMLLYAAAQLKQPTIILVWQERQQKVWLDRIPLYFDFAPGGIGGVFKHPKIAPITVGMVQSVRNRMDELRMQFGCVICDEVQRFAARTLREVVNGFPAAIRLGASDDERRKDQREFLLYDTFGPMGWELEEKDGQCDVNVLAVPTNFFQENFGDLTWPERLDEITTDKRRNQLIVDLACMEVREGHPVIIWSDRVDHCIALKKMLRRRKVSAGLIIGGEEFKKEANNTEKRLNEGTISVGIGTSISEQSINIPRLTVGIMTCASADKELFRFKQMRGRLARPHESKESAWIYYLWDRRVLSLSRKIYNIKRRYTVTILGRN